MPNRRQNYADVDRARTTWAAQKRRYRSRTGSGYGRRAWTEAEEAAVLDHSTSDRDLAARLGRSVQSIQIKRVRLTARMRVSG